MGFIKVMKVAGLVAMIAGLLPLQATAQPASSSEVIANAILQKDAGLRGFVTQDTSTSEPAFRPRCTVLNRRCELF
ncbi:hypothetical protein [uncultured Ruegeria sp.]|uniref:hypothetical protein n=1 Tax=uncultured Ruegeria sp. TaxID=259304 RepID=UPI00263195BF|nr:hypothetical protein [uncultured Ruegeria sp.]